MPVAPDCIQLVRSGTNSLKLLWTSVSSGEFANTKYVCKRKTALTIFSLLFGDMMLDSV